MPGAFFLGIFTIFAQYPPPAGQPGTTAIYKDSSLFCAWAESCVTEIGFINFADTTVVHNGSNRATYGFAEDALGLPDNFVVSLGDRGMATLTFPFPMADYTGPDFAIFENAFSDEFLELAYVEVSSDGNRFVRFPAVSLTQTINQVPTFGTLDATKIHNFAGKYRVFYGTPFDLSDLQDSTGIDLQYVTHVRIIDVGGSVTDGFQSFDSQGNVINDPWPTPFFTCGLDLDAVGLIHKSLSIDENQVPDNSILLYPNPVIETLHIQLFLTNAVFVSIFDVYGNLCYENTIQNHSSLSMTTFPSGLYMARFVTSGGGILTKRIIKQ